MILCVHAPDRRRLELLRDADDLRLGETPWAQEFGEVKRLYFGVGFCQHLLSPAEDAIAAAELAAERGWGLTYITSYVTDAFLTKTMDVVAALVAAQAPDLEVVVDDWGVLRRVRGEHPTVRLVLGRGLNRMVRDPRVPDVGPEHLGGDEVPTSWGGSSLGSAAFRALLRRFGVKRGEADVPLQGLTAGATGDTGGAPAEGMATAVHLPYGMVASGRICMVSAYGKPPSTRFVPPLACDAPCRDTTLTLRAPWSRRDEGAEALPVSEGAFIPLTKLLNRRRNALPEPKDDAAPRFLQKGNTHFYELDGDRLDAALAWAKAEPTVDRVVVEVDLPM
ncbi:MAG: hypothetical protein KDA24_12645 [Deltaproteobacteria bacterium]|nr:hypothetical protein [Deltaproteobacteria bacterium]